MTGATSVEADVELLVAEHPAELQAIEHAIRRLIRDEAPAAEERVDFGNELIAFGWTMGMGDLLFAIIRHTGWVNLQLADGVDLPDPSGIVEGTGKRIRHVKVRSLEGAANLRLRQLVRAQIALRPAPNG